MPHSAEPIQRSSDRKGIFLISALAGIIAGLCCFSPVILVLLGLATISTAASLGDMLYGDYRWWFRMGGLIFLTLALLFYFRRRGVCTLSEARRQRNRIVNVSLLVLIFSVGIYIFWTYVAVQQWGIMVGLPWAQYNENWALPTSAAVLAIGLVLYIRSYHRSSGSHPPEISTPAEDSTLARQARDSR
jgi:hypothetical protein